MVLSKLRLILTTVIIVALPAVAAAQNFHATNSLPAKGNAGGAEFVESEVLVKFSENVTDDQIAGAFRGAGLQMIKQIQTRLMQQRGSIGITRARTAMPVAQAVALLRQLPGVDYAEPNWIYTHQATSNDPYFTDGSLWGMYGDATTPVNAFGSQAAEAWAAGHIGSASVVVGIIDEGVQITHPDLAANIWTNPSEQPNGIDDDGNGKVDDIHGWDFYENNSSVYDSTGDDHGTHVAGTIGAVGGNGIGVAGVNWAVTLIPGKFLGPQGGTTEDAVEAVDYFTDLRLNRGVRIVALNNSWGGGPYSQALHDAIIRAAKADILFVAAAGNGDWRGRAVNIDANPYYPACYNTTQGTTTETAAAYDSVIAVTAIDSKGSKASFANYGATTVDLGAPGVGVLSTYPSSAYAFADGTSMATPHVTGAIALYASTHPAATAAEIRQAILGSTIQTSSLSGKTVTGGRLNLSQIITPPAPPTQAPTVPSSFAATAQSYSQIRLTWTDAQRETEYRLTRTTGETITLGANVTQYTDSGLDPSTAYTYTLVAWNTAGSTTPVTASATTQPAPEPTAATFVGIDSVTQGSWLGKYGQDGYDIILYKDNPDYGFIDANGFTLHYWNTSTSDVRALQDPSGATRLATCWYSFDTTGGFYFLVNIEPGSVRRLSLYCLDWDRQQRQETIELYDAIEGSLLDSQYVDQFGDGKHMVWDITGPVIARVKWNDNTASTGDNAAVSGVFLGPVPNPPPTVSITAPLPNAELRGTVSLKATASDDGPVSKVEFYCDGVLIGPGTQGTEGWSLEWNSATVAEGSHTLTAKAYDSANQVTQSAPVSVAVNNIDDPPTVVITSPAAGQTVKGTVTVTAIATDDGSVTSVQFLADGTPVATDGNPADGWSFAWDTTAISDGSHTLTAVATDDLAKTTISTPVTVTVANAVPPALHCGDLDGSGRTSGSTWTATITVLVHDANEATVAGATVSASWSGAKTGSGSALTAGSGLATFTVSGIPKNKTSLTCTVNGIVKDSVAYDSDANHDPDGDSNGTAITVRKP